jgi:hypothetical protein
MYFVSGYVLIHRDWFPSPRQKTITRTESLSSTGSREPSAYSSYLRQAFDLTGKPNQGRLADGSWQFNYSRPGTLYEAVVTPAEDRVLITTRKENTVETMISFHRLHGYGGGKLYNVWAFLYDLASFSLIVFAFTGVYLWYKLTKRRLLGWILLGVSYGYAAVTILYLIYAP